MSHAPMPDAQGLAEPLRSRWSPSVYDAAHTLTDDEVALLLEAARWAPSAGNSQPWRFVVAPRGSAAHAALLPHLSRGNSGWVPRASLVLVAGCEVVDVKSPEVARHDLGQAVAHVTLQARAMGLHTHQFAGFDHEAAAAALGVPDSVRLVAGIAVGVPGDPAEVDERDADRDRRERSRRPLAEIAYVDGWRPWRG
ncbi:nitroreductase family protein [Nocardioides litoris]|uniref:nitroreductase family protein n=1 Tax=Nocardioides litoris TaxID=1926648 RepID=UPI001FE6341F|nr:nitroreductase family protein [Nocardioides litoris]